MTFLAPLDNASIPIEPDPQNRSKNTVSSYIKSGAGYQVDV